MTSCPMRALPTRSPSRDLGRGARALAATLALFGATAHAHEVSAEAIPDEPGWRVGSAVAIVGVEADERWPPQTWPGVLIDGTSPRDMRGSPRIEHATLDLAARLTTSLALHTAIGWHDRDSAHFEAARLQWRWLRGTDRIEATAGRDTVRMGSVIDAAGHFDLFSQMPLAKRAVTNGMWIDDGATVAWRTDTLRGLRSVEVGAWSGRKFPGSENGDLAASVQLNAGWGDVEVQLFAARLHPEGRGAVVQTAGQEGHLHNPPDCSAGLAQLVCFDGRSDVYGAALRWEQHDLDLTVSIAGLARHERGRLYSLSGEADYRATTNGMWADVAWQPAARWTVAARLERLVPTSELNGVGASLLAREANLEGAGPVERATVALLRQLPWGLQVAVEAGHEHRHALDTRHVALRVIWWAPRLLGGAL